MSAEPWPTGMEQSNTAFIDFYLEIFELFSDIYLNKFILSVNRISFEFLGLFY